MNLLKYVFLKIVFLLIQSTITMSILSFGSTRSLPFQESNRWSDPSFKILWEESHWNCLV